MTATGIAQRLRATVDAPASRPPPHLAARRWRSTTAVAGEEVATAQGRFFPYPRCPAGARQVRVARVLRAFAAVAPIQPGIPDRRCGANLL